MQDKEENNFLKFKNILFLDLVSEKGYLDQAGQQCMISMSHKKDYGISCFIISPYLPCSGSSGNNMAARYCLRS